MISDRKLKQQTNGAKKHRFRLPGKTTILSVRFFLHFLGLKKYSKSSVIVQCARCKREVKFLQVKKRRQKKKCCFQSRCEITVQQFFSVGEF